MRQPAILKASSRASLMSSSFDNLAILGQHDSEGGDGQQFLDKKERNEGLKNKTYLIHINSFLKNSDSLLFGVPSLTFWLIPLNSNRMLLVQVKLKKNIRLLSDGMHS